MSNIIEQIIQDRSSEAESEIRRRLSNTNLGQSTFVTSSGTESTFTTLDYGTYVDLGIRGTARVAPRPFFEVFEEDLPNNIESDILNRADDIIDEYLDI